MNSVQHQAAVIFAAGMVCALIAACTVRQARIPPDTIPGSPVPTIIEESEGKEIFTDLSEDYQVDSSSLRHKRLREMFNDLAAAARIEPDEWHIHLFDDPEVVDVRAVRGNYIFIWSGVFAVTENEDELAGLLASELAHGLARHTKPVEFSLGSELLFGVSDMVTSIGLLVLTQGAVAVSGTGMTRWIYVEAADLDPIDRVYNDAEVREMADIAVLILDRSDYWPGALLQFWERAAIDPLLRKRLKRLSRKLSPQRRVAVLEAALAEPPLQEERQGALKGGDKTFHTTTAGLVLAAQDRH